MATAAATTLLPTPERGRAAAEAWVRAHLGDLTREGPDGVAGSPRFRGGQTAAEAALEALEVRGYARGRNEVWPPERRAASAISPYVRYGLLGLGRVWEHVAGAPAGDRDKFRDELLWQEYARHLYARLGRRLRAPLRHAPPPGEGWDEPWPRDMACVDLSVGQLEEEGWLVNQQRLWLASQYAVRAGHDWREGEDRFFAHLLDGSRAANRLGWQWVVGTAIGKPYGFSRAQVEKRAPGLCERCPRVRDCPIQRWPAQAGGARVDSPDGLRGDPGPGRTAGPHEVQRRGGVGAVWLTAESLGDDDPALTAHPGAPAVFVSDEALLAGLRLSGKKLVFFAETLADLAGRREVEVHRGDPAAVVAGRGVAVTHAPVPGFRRRVARSEPAEVHPWPWLVRPHGGPAQSFSAWRRAARLGPSVPRRRRRVR